VIPNVKHMTRKQHLRSQQRVSLEARVRLEHLAEPWEHGSAIGKARRRPITQTGGLSCCQGSTAGAGALTVEGR
jgi:hypothetical protein